MVGSGRGQGGAGGGGGYYYSTLQAVSLSASLSPHLFLPSSSWLLLACSPHSTPAHLASRSNLSEIGGGAATATATRASKGLKASRLDWMAQWLKQSDEEKVHWHSWFEAEMVGGLGYSPSWVSRSG